jgi:hypothetical protein
VETPVFNTEGEVADLDNDRRLLYRPLVRAQAMRRCASESGVSMVVWLCGLGLEDAVPEHSTFRKNRHGRFLDKLRVLVRRQLRVAKRSLKPMR